MKMVHYALFTDIFNREKLKAHTKGTTGNTMMQKFTSLCSLLGMPVKLSNGIAGENNNQTCIPR